jgi:DNA mismatch repair protein MutS2
MQPTIPNTLEHTGARALEWPRLRSLVAGFAQSAAGRGWIEALEPSRNLAWIDQEQCLVEESRMLVRAGGNFSFADLREMRESLQQSRIDGVALDGTELLAIAFLASKMAAWGELLRLPPGDLEGKLPQLTERAALLMDAAVRVRLQQLSAAVEARIDPDGSVAENASPELRRVRRWPAKAAVRTS